MSLLHEDINLVFPSNPEAGAIPIGNDGNHFRHKLAEPLYIPPEAKSCQLIVNEASVWNTSPNIIEGVNDKLYVSAHSEPTHLPGKGVDDDPDATLQYPLDCVLSTVSDAANRYISIQTTGDAANMPDPAPWQDGDILQIDSGTHTGLRFEVTDVHTTNLGSEHMVHVVGHKGVQFFEKVIDFSRIRPGANEDFVVVIPEGIYELPELNQAIAHWFSDTHYGDNPPLTLIPAKATQKVIIHFNVRNISVDFAHANGDTVREVIGFNARLVEQLNDEFDYIADRSAEFNTISFFLISTDLISTGIVYAGVQGQVICKVIGDVPVGSEIVYAPRNPRRLNASELIGKQIREVEFFLQNNNQVGVKTDDVWSIDLTLRYSTIV